MDYWTAAELETILKAPKRRHVEMLVAEVRRLTGIAFTAEVILKDGLAGGTGRLQAVLKERLDAPRTPVED